MIVFNMLGKVIAIALEVCCSSIHNLATLSITILFRALSEVFRFLVQASADQAWAGGRLLI